LLQNVLHHFGHTGTAMYRGHPYSEFRSGCCEVHVDILAHPSDPGMTAWFTTATGDDLDDTLERAAHLALIECCECHLSGLAGTAIALLPIQNVGDSERSTYHTGWAFMARYAQHMSSMF
jgi:hypothetical protein